MRLRNVEETEGTTRAAAPIHCRGSDGTVGDGCRRTLPCHLSREPILPHGGSYFSKWLECFPVPATTVARKLVLEIVARYGAFRELHSDHGTNFGSKVVLEVCRLFFCFCFFLFKFFHTGIQVKHYSLLSPCGACQYLQPTLLVYIILHNIIL